MKASLPYKSIKTRKNGKWYIVFDYKDHSGNRKRKWVNTKLPETCSKKALKEAEEAIKAEFDKSIAEGEIAVKSASAVPNAVMSDEGASEMSLGDFFSEADTHQTERGSYNTSLLSQDQQQIHGVHKRKLSGTYAWTGKSQPRSEFSQLQTRQRLQRQFCETVLSRIALCICVCC